jgi:hypothetical protein
MAQVRDMGYMYVLGDCWSCGRLFMFSAERVPSIVIDGERQPVCESCITLANEERKAKGMPVIAVLPGAYEPDEV